MVHTPPRQGHYVILLAVLLLTGCGQAGQGAPSAGPSTPATAGPSSAAAVPSTTAPSVTPSPTKAASTPTPTPSPAKLPTATLKPPAGSVASKSNEINAAEGRALEFYNHPSGCSYGAWWFASTLYVEPERASSQKLLTSLQRSSLIKVSADPVVTQLTTDRGPVNALVQTGEGQQGDRTIYVVRTSRTGQAVALVLSCPTKAFSQSAWDGFRTGSVFAGFDATPDFRD